MGYCLNAHICPPFLFDFLVEGYEVERLAGVDAAGQAYWYHPVPSYAPVEQVIGTIAIWRFGFARWIQVLQKVVCERHRYGQLTVDGLPSFGLGG